MKSKDANSRFNEQYLRDVWAKVDSRIALPEGISADVLLKRLDDIEQPKDNLKRLRFSPRMFTWQSGATYAAAFLLIIALSVTLGRLDKEPANMLEGTISADQMPQNEPLHAYDDAPFTPAQERSMQASMVQAEGSADPSVDLEPAPRMAGGADPFASDIQAFSADAEGIGGQSPSVVLHQDAKYTYTYRANDATDPDREGYPVTANILDAQTGALVLFIDIPDMASIQYMSVVEDVLVLIGQDTDTVIRTYDISDPSEPMELTVKTQPGVYIDANIYKNIAYLITLSEGNADTGCDVVQLPGTDEKVTCIITSLDLQTQAVNSKAFAGADGEITLFKLNAYLRYSGEMTEDNKNGQYAAQIRLNGTEIELGGNS